MIINYGVTQQGLTEQLLNVTVKHERPDLEAARETLIKVCTCPRRVSRCAKVPRGQHSKTNHPKTQRISRPSLPSHCRR